MKVLVFGTGNTYRRFRHFFEHMEIAGFVDNNPAIWGTRIEGTIVIPPEKVPETEFDFIFLVSIYYESMRKQPGRLWIRIIEDFWRTFPRQSIICFHKKKHMENMVKGY